MPSVFDRLLLQNTAEIIFVVLIVTVAGVIILAVFILTRRVLRRRYFARRDRRSQYIRHNWRKILEGGIPVETVVLQPARPFHRGRDCAGSDGRCRLQGTWATSGVCPRQRAAGQADT